MKNLKIKVHWSFLLLGILMLVYGKFATFACCMICVLLHEMGHSIVGRRLGYKLNIITLLPYGAMLSGDNSVFSKGDEIKIAVAGPIVNAVLIIISTPIYLILPIKLNFLWEFIICNIYTLSFNLLPVYPLDGGRILLSALTSKMPYSKARKISKIIGYSITSAFFVLFFLSFFSGLNYMLGINALFMLIGLIDDDKKVYYEKLSSFDKFKPMQITGKIIKLDKTTPLFEAYKKLVESKAMQIQVTEKGRVIKKFSKNLLLSKILNSSIDTKLENIE